MNELFIKKINPKKEVSFVEAEHLLELKAVSNPINTINWNSFAYVPQVNFRIAHLNNNILLKFYVIEKAILAQETQINGSVYKDSCVEFFISLDGKNYYNFEFNCIGTIHLAYGSGRKNRKFVSPEIIKNIEIKSTLGNRAFKEKKGSFEWEMMIRIPIKSFSFDSIKTFNKLKATANLYKCGDDTSDPHYLSWNPIKTENPDFHRPEYFGEVLFE